MMRLRGGRVGERGAGNGAQGVVEAVKGRRPRLAGTGRRA